MEPLVGDLQSGVPFSKGVLAARLAAANVPALEESEQRRLGVAVGQRAARETFTVRIDGIDACAQDPGRWPDPYREGVTEGLFINEDGRVYAYPAISAPCAAELLQHHSASERALAELRAILRTASWSLPFQQHYTEVIEGMRAAPHVPSQAQPLWNTIISELGDRAPYGTA